MVMIPALGPDVDAGLVLAAADLARARDRFASRGVVVLGPPALDARVFGALAAETPRQRTRAGWELDGTRRSGFVDQMTVRAELGPAARALLAAGSTISTLRAVTGEHLRPSWAASCMTYYEQPGQFLGEHTDKQSACRYAVLVYVHVAHCGTAGGQGTTLCVRLLDPGSGTLAVTAAANRVVILYGSRLPHWRPPLMPGEAVSLLAGCFAPVHGLPVVAGRQAVESGLVQTARPGQDLREFGPAIGPIAAGAVQRRTGG